MDALAAVLVVMLGASGGQPTSAAPVAVPSAPIRVLDSRVSVLLADGLRRSPTLRWVVERVQAGQVIVFIDTVRWLPGEMAGTLKFIGSSPPYRFVKISVRDQASADGLLATIGHELQHVIEVLDNPSVLDDQSLLSLYRAIGTPTSFSKLSWDTAEARWMGEQVQRELKGVRTEVSADGDR